MAYDKLFYYKILINLRKIVISGKTNKNDF